MSLLFSEFAYDIVLDSARQEVNRRAVIADTETASASFTMMVSKNVQACRDHESFIVVGIFIDWLMKNKLLYESGKVIVNQY